MRFCPPHWKKLRKAIKKRDLDHLVAQGGEAAARNLASEMASGPSIQTFDPLMAAHNAIVANAMRLVGLELMRGDRCPICYTSKMHEQTCTGKDCSLPRKGAFENWIDLAADGAAKSYQRLLAEAQPDA